jgi:hypothetical protein
MRITNSLLAGCFVGALLAMTAGDRALAQAIEPAPVTGAYTRRPPVYPYVRVSPHFYRKAVRHGFAPVQPPAITVHQDGRGLYGPPYYAYPRPPLGYSGYAGFSGTDPSAYRSVIPPPIPPTMPRARSDSESATTTPAEPIPTPPSDPGPKI